MQTENFQMFQLDLENADEPQRSNSQHPFGSQKKQKNSRKASTSASLTKLKPLCGPQQTVENSDRDGNTRPPDRPHEKPVCRSKSNS